MEMQLPDRASFVAGVLQESLNHGLGLLVRRVIDSILVGMGVAASEEAHPGRDADRGLDARLGEVGGTRCKLIKMRRLDDAVAIGAKAVQAPLVEHDEKHVGTISRRNLRGRGGSASLYECATCD